MRGRLRLVFFVVAGTSAVTLATLLHAKAGLTWPPTVEGLAFTAAGMAAWSRWPESRIGTYLVAYAFLNWAIQLERIHIPLVWTLGFPLFAWSFPALVAAFVTFPTGRIRTRGERVIIGLTIANTVWQTLFFLFFDPSVMGCGLVGGDHCGRGLNLMLVHSSPRLIIDLAQVDPYLTSAFFIATAWLLVTRWIRATSPARWILGPFTVAAVVWLVANELAGVAQITFFYVGRIELLGSRPGLLRLLNNISEGAIILLPLTFLVGLAGSRLRHARVSRLVVELGELPRSDRLEDALRRALGDSRLKVGVWHDDSGRYVRATGEELVLPDNTESRVATRIERDGAPLGVVIHDRALLDEPGLVEATSAAARLAVENERLQSAVEAQLEEVRASRHRILEAQDQERRRIERNLHDGAQQRLLRLSMALQVADSRLGAVDSDPALRTSLEVAGEELAAALLELRQLAQGIHPSVLTQRGLAAALHTLAETAALPVVIEEAPTGRMNEQAETAGYYVVSEALANVTKHAAATRAFVTARIDGNRLEVSVTDDGSGGASLDRGSGLRGLADRVEALDGELAVISRPGIGTTVTATIPLA